MVNRLTIASVVAVMLTGTSPTFAEDFNPSDTYHENDLHCAVGGAASCARPTDYLDINTQAGSVSLPETPSATADDIEPGVNGTSTLSNVGQ